MAFTLRIITRLFVVLSLGLSCVYAARDLRELASTETGTYTVPTVPDVMKVPAGYKLHLKLFGEGHQYYRFNGSNWVQFSAYASLYDEERKEIGHHYYLTHPDALGGQPSWVTQPSKGVPYSIVTAKPLVKTTPDPRNIPWILLKTTKAQGDKGYFGDIAYVQRYNTSEGLAPPSASGAEVGRVRKTSYSASYAFYV
ncbi:hypothetical protein KC19_7G011100 [Ceratodon purpureus]|uniref:Uncharacterized protein n=1 Tax=Ceratodon purpureus TaxID=3225 RepID=A0A8T0H1H0_CERPU|nr:hypothetical protein KC19_7G011100 [Ceratodon purpureus]